MSNNRIINLKSPPPAGGDVPLKMEVTWEPGFVKITFDPAVVRMRMTSKAVRQFAIGLLINADKADEPPATIVEPNKS